MRKRRIYLALSIIIMFLITSVNSSCYCFGIGDKQWCGSAVNGYTNVADLSQFDFEATITGVSQDYVNVRVDVIFNNKLFDFIYIDCDVYIIQDGHVVAQGFIRDGYVFRTNPTQTIYVDCITLSDERKLDYNGLTAIVDYVEVKAKQYNQKDLQLNCNK